MTHRALPVTERLIDIDPARDGRKLVTDYRDPWGFKRKAAPAQPAPLFPRLLRLVRAS